MAYLAVVYPKLAAADFDWIQDYRRANDSRYFDLIGPHFTLVFAVHDIERRDFVAEIERQAAGVAPFAFNLRVATINFDDSRTYYHEFLVPDAGYASIVKLHDRLYSGLLSRHLRLDLDFIPHIGIGNSDQAAVSKARVDALNGRGVDISGTVDVIDIVEYRDGVVRTLETVALG